MNLSVQALHEGTNSMGFMRCADLELPSISGHLSPKNCSMVRIQVCSAYALLIHKITQTQIHTTSAEGKISHWDVYEHVQIKWMKTTKSPRSHKVSELRSLVHR